MKEYKLVELNETLYLVYGVYYTLEQYIDEFSEKPTINIDHRCKGTKYKQYVADYDRLSKCIKKHFANKEEFEECRKNTKYLYVYYSHWDYIFSDDNPFVLQYPRGIFDRAK